MIAACATACNKVLTATSGRILSPRWPNNYPTNVNCELRIITPPGNKISLFFSVFRIERHSRCNFDYLAVSYSAQRLGWGAVADPAMGGPGGRTPPPLTKT